MSTLKVGDRVALAPHTDTWMRGDRYGTVTSFTRGLALVLLEPSGRSMRLHPVVLTKVDSR